MECQPALQQSRGVGGGFASWAPIGAGAFGAARLTSWGAQKAPALAAAITRATGRVRAAATQAAATIRQRAAAINLADDTGAVTLDLFFFFKQKIAATPATHQLSRPLTQSEAATLADALSPNNLGHIFVSKHKFAPLVETFGSEANAMEQIVRSLHGAYLPISGKFVATTLVEGQQVVIRGAVVNTIARIGTAFTP